MRKIIYYFLFISAILGRIECKEKEYEISTYYSASCGTTGINFYPKRSGDDDRSFTTKYGPSPAFTSDNLDYVVRKLVDNDVSIYAGTYNVSSPSPVNLNGDGGLAISATFDAAWMIEFDTVGNMYISDSFNNKIRKVDGLTNIISTFAGDGTNQDIGATDSGDATSASLFRPNNLFVDSTGDYLYFADRRNHRIRKIDFATQQISTVVGAALSPRNGGYSGDGGPASSALLRQPYGVISDTIGNLYIADTNNNLIRKVDTFGIITTVAGESNAGYNGDNIAATSAKLNAPRAVWVDTDGIIFIADTSNNLVRKVDEDGIITTIAGIPGSVGYNGDDFNSIYATLNFPVNIIGDGTGDLYVSEFNSFRVRRLTPFTFTEMPTMEPTESPTDNPTMEPTVLPTTDGVSPTASPTCSPAPTAKSSTQWPTKTKKPSNSPTTKPSNPSTYPTFKPTRTPSSKPTGPSPQPTPRPTKQPVYPTISPSEKKVPTAEPTPTYNYIEPTQTNEPTPSYNSFESINPSLKPVAPTSSPVSTLNPTFKPSKPSYRPSLSTTPTQKPVKPSYKPTAIPTSLYAPSQQPTKPSYKPTARPTSSYKPSQQPSEPCDDSSEPTSSNKPSQKPN
eukprot:gene7176-9785_t